MWAALSRHLPTALLLRGDQSVFFVLFQQAWGGTGHTHSWPSLTGTHAPEHTFPSARHPARSWAPRRPHAHSTHSRPRQTAPSGSPYPSTSPCCLMILWDSSLEILPWNQCWVL